MKNKLLLTLVSVLSFSAAFPQIEVRYAAPVPDTVYVQKVTKKGYEDREVKTWEAQAYAESQIRKRFEWGVKGGVNTTGITKSSQIEFTHKYQGIGLYSVTNENLGVGWDAGAFGRVNFGKFNIQLEALYHNSRTLSTHMKFAGNEGKFIRSEIVSHSLDIPVEFGFKYSIFRIYLGPQFSARLGQSKKFSIDSGLSEMVSNMDGGYLINRVDIKNPVVFFHYGVSFEFWHVMVDISNSVPFTKSRQVFTVVDREQEYRMRLNSWQFMLGFKF